MPRIPNEVTPMSGIVVLHLALESVFSYLKVFPLCYLASFYKISENHKTKRIIWFILIYSIYIFLDNYFSTIYS